MSTKTKAMKHPTTKYDPLKLPLTVLDCNTAKPTKHSRHLRPREYKTLADAQDAWVRWTGKNDAPDWHTVQQQKAWLASHPDTTENYRDS